MGTFIILINSGSWYSPSEKVDILRLIGEKYCFKYCYDCFGSYGIKIVYGMLACMVLCLLLLLILRQFSAYKRERLTTKESYLFSSFADLVHWEHLAFEDEYPL